MGYERWVWRGEVRVWRGEVRVWRGEARVRVRSEGCGCGEGK